MLVVVVQFIFYACRFTLIILFTIMLTHILSIALYYNSHTN